MNKNYMLAGWFSAILLTFGCGVRYDQTSDALLKIQGFENFEMINVKWNDYTIYELEGRIGQNGFIAINHYDTRIKETIRVYWRCDGFGREYGAWKKGARSFPGSLFRCIKDTNGNLKYLVRYDCSKLDKVWPSTDYNFVATGNSMDEDEFDLEHNAHDYCRAQSFKDLEAFGSEKALFGASFIPRITYSKVVNDIKRYGKRVY